MNYLANNNHLSLDQNDNLSLNLLLEILNIFSPFLGTGGNVPLHSLLLKLIISIFGKS